jgi:hypothetical protein
VRNLFLILFALNVSVSLGQTKLRLGVSLDPICSWFSPKNGEIQRDGARFGMNGGLMVEYYFAPNYGFLSGLSITSQGGNLLYNDTVYISAGDQEPVKLSPGTSVSYGLSYLSIPLGLKLKSNEIGLITYFAQIGFLPQINIGSRAKASGGGLDKDNVPEEINIVNLSYFFGGGIEYNIGGQTSLTAGLFFNNGFIDVFSSNDYKAGLNSLTLRLGILF